MGLTPRETDRLSVWEYLACLSGWNAAHGGKRDGGGDMSMERLRELGVMGA